MACAPDEVLGDVREKVTLDPRDARMHVALLITLDGACALKGSAERAAYQPTEAEGDRDQGNDAQQKGNGHVGPL
jgi:hypothetical protein